MMHEFLLVFSDAQSVTDFLAQQSEYSAQGGWSSLAWRQQGFQGTIDF
jgi:hypothetical protein